MPYSNDNIPKKTLGPFVTSRIFLKSRLTLTCYYVPCIILSILHTLHHLILTQTLLTSIVLPIYQEETKTQRKTKLFASCHIWEMAELGPGCW